MPPSGSKPSRFQSDGERFHLLVDAVTDYAIYMVDPEGFVVTWNIGAERLKGYTEAEIIGQNYSQFFTQDERNENMPLRILDEAKHQGRCETEGWRVRKDGTRFCALAVVHAIYEKSGRHIGFSEITRDITEIRGAQQALRESERQFRLLMNSVTDYALFMLDLNGTITSWNTGAQRMNGYAADEVIGQHFSNFYTENEREAGVPARSLQAAAKEGRFETEGWRVRKDGSLFWADVAIDPVYDEQGNHIGFAKITRDITERREARKGLEQAHVQLAHAQKMEALGELTGGVAHDFNNLLMVISGFISVVKERLADDPKGLKAANAIEVAAKRGEALTRQLLSFSRRQSLNPATLHLAETIDTIRPVLGSTLSGQFKLEERIAHDLWPVRLDVSEFELALLNLVVNARDAMGDHGTIILAAENFEVQEGGLAPSNIVGKFVALSVRDDGCGIPADILPKVFDPFFTTKDAGKGTGLGLSQVHGFAHQCGGTVSVESEIGKGTCITLYLPMADAEPIIVPSLSEENLPDAQGSVLLVEDNREVAAATRELLEHLGYHVEIVEQAEAALQRLERTEFDLLLSDIVMAGQMNGLELARTVRQRYPSLPVLLATGYSTAAQHAPAEFTVLRKPYHAPDLARAIARVRERAKGGRTRIA